MTKIRTHYDNLKVTRNAPDVVIRAAHKALLQMHHPDKSQDKVAAERITRILNDALDVLLDPVRRKQHDDWIREQERRHSGQHRHAHHAPDAHTPKPKPHEDERIGKFTVHGDGTATDNETGLTWCRFALGQNWHGNAVHGEAQMYNWQDALDAADAFNLHGGYAGRGDWRVPDIGELKSLFDKQAGDKKAGTQFIDSRVFLDNPHWLWSSTPYAGYGGGAWYAHFGEGEAINDDKHLLRAVRLVRG